MHKLVERYTNQIVQLQNSRASETPAVINIEYFYARTADGCYKIVHTVVISHVYCAYISDGQDLKLRTALKNALQLRRNNIVYF